MGEVVVIILPAVLSFCLAWYLVPRIESLYQQAGIIRLNYRGNPITPSLGMVIPISWLPAAVWMSSVYYYAYFSAEAQSVGIADNTGPYPLIVFLIIGMTMLGMCLPGIFDDIINEETRGLRGHAKAFQAGFLTSGIIKATWGLLLGGFIVLNMGLKSFTSLIVALPMIPLWANALNLLDRRPGRSLKFFLVSLTSLIFLTFFQALKDFNGYTMVNVLQRGMGDNQYLFYLMLLLPLAGIGVALLPFDLQAKAMLGDAGSNSLGAVLGVLILIMMPLPWQLAWLGVAVILNFAGEFASLSRIIDNVPMLSFLDRLGRGRN